MQGSQIFARHTTAVYMSLKTCMEERHVMALSIVSMMVWVASFDLMCYR